MTGADKAMQRYHLLLEYDGSFFCGWQAQKEGQTPPGVQSVIAQALFGFCQTRTVIYAAGRTDAGVHALGQHIHFDLEKTFCGATLARALNWHLRKMGWGGKVAILRAAPVAQTFHARFSAVKRFYCYRIIIRPEDLVLEAKRAWHLRHALDGAVLERSGKLFEGCHDFTAFRAAGCQSASPVKTLDRISLERIDKPCQHEWHIRFEARSFLQHQVRALVGAMVEAGSGRIRFEALAKILAAGKRTQAPSPAPPHGLYLENVAYGGDGEEGEK